MLTASKFAYWDESSNHGYYPTYQTASSSNSYGSCGTFASGTPYDYGVSPAGSSCSRESTENQRDDFRELIDKIIENEKISLMESQPRDACSSRDQCLQRNVNNSYSGDALHAQFNTHNSSSNSRSSTLPSADYHKELIKNSSFLAKFYNPDGTPLKSLWDSDSSIKDLRSYKYEPKPLERRKNPRSFVPDEKKTADYWERRKKNNMAARKSREERRKNEIEVLEAVKNLVKENVRMKIHAQELIEENQSLQLEIEMLKRLP